MNKRYLESKMKLYGDSNDSLAKYLHITPQTLSAKKNGTNGAEFVQGEMMEIKKRYDLTAEEMDLIFFANEVS